ncbi:MAG: hypothetical protein Q9160_007540 [Pyrenula sp. 1 TL-2023]
MGAPLEKLSHPVQPRTSWRKPAWRLGAAAAAGGVLFTLIVNTATAIELAQRFGGFQDGTATLYTGSCDKVNTMNTWIHLTINVLGTLLLSGSNYCMQCLCAPTRADIDKAHAERRWMDIGVQSIRNLRRIGAKRALLWWSLALSSIPLHLFYNSTFFSAITVNEYGIAVVSDGFVDGAPFIGPESLEPCREEIQLWRDREIINGLKPDEGRSDLIFLDINDKFKLEDLQINARNFDNLTKEECIGAYANDFLTTRGNLILVSDLPDPKPPQYLNNSLLDLFTYSFVGYSITNYRPYDWICDSDSRYDQSCSRRVGALLKRFERGDPWTIRRQWGTFDYRMALANGTRGPDGFDIRYCLSEQLPQACSLHFSYSLIFVVIAFNIVELVGMLVTVFSLGQMNPLITIGDAIDSFMTKSDPSTKGMCLVDRDAFTSIDSFLREWSFPPREFTAQRRLWASAASGLRWTAVLFFFFTALIVSLSLLSIGLSGLKSGDHTTSLWSLGFGTVRVSALITGMQWSKHIHSIASLTIIANLPQTILSFLYLCFNGLATSMVLATEWAGYQHRRKPLRVSEPRKSGGSAHAQRATYFLQLPYRFAVPLLALSGILHWLVSQSLFLANVVVRSHGGEIVDEAGLLTCGYSPIAIIFTLVVGVLLLIGGIVFGLKRTSSDMPMASSCSAAIAAACHHSQSGGDEEARHGGNDAGLPLQWGAVEGENEREEEQEEGKGRIGRNKNRIGHCCFSSGPVLPLVEGKKYA